jgi:hypothetical protein
MKKFLVLVMVLVTAAVMTSCAGYTPQVSLPTYIQKMAVPVFINKTQTYNIEQYVTQKTIDQFIADGKLSITDEQSADGILKVTIDRYILTAVTHDINQVPQKYQLRIYVSIYLFDNKNQRQLWSEENMWEEDSYYVVNNLGMPAETEEISRMRILDKLAGRVFRRVMNGW